MALDLPPASLGSRIVSGLIDVAVTMILFVAAIFVFVIAALQADGALIWASFIATMIVVFLGLPDHRGDAHRAASRSASWRCGLRTVRDDAGPITFQHAFVRALIGFVEIYVFTGVPAFFSALMSSRGKRLGDYAAGTYVVRDRVRLRLSPAAADAPAAGGVGRGGRHGVACRPGWRSPSASSSAGCPPSTRSRGPRSAPGWPSRSAQYVAPAPPPGTPPEAYLAAVIAVPTRARPDPAAPRGRAAPTARPRAGDHGRASRATSSSTCAGPVTTPTGTTPSRWTSRRSPRWPGISKYHFQRLFTATYGRSPAAHLSQRRVERAQDLLRATNLTVTEVCHAVGFSSLGSFSSRFRELVGETPSEFQRRYAADGAPRIPGCFVFMWGLAAERSASQEKPRTTGGVLASSHDHQHRHRVASS